MNETKSIDTKQKALNKITSLAQKFDISVDEISRALSPVSSAPPQTSASQEKEESISLITKVFAYLGSVFFIGGIAAFTVIHWTHLTSFERVCIPLVPGFLLYLTAVIYYKNEYVIKLFNPIYILGYILQVVGLYTLLHEYFESTHQWESPTMFVFGLLFVQQIFSFLAHKKTTQLFCAIVSISFFYFAFMEEINFDEEYFLSLYGIALLGITYYLDKTPYRAMSPFWYFFAGIFTLIGLFIILEDNRIDFIILLPTCFLTYLSTLVRSKTLLAVSIIALFGFLGYFTAEYFSDSLGWPLILLFLGGVLFGLSILGVKLGKRF